MPKIEVDEETKERVKEYIDDDDNLVTSQKRLVTRAVNKLLDTLQKDKSLKEFDGENDE